MTEPNGSTPKIGKPVHAVPDAEKTRGRYADLWQQALALPVGDWLPVEFASRNAVANFQTGSYRPAKDRGLVIHRRGLIAYIGKEAR